MRQEYELLDQTRRQLAARTVLMDTFRDLGEGSTDGDEPSGGTPRRPG